MSLKDEALALQPPFHISRDYIYRDGSGTYACPHCHYLKNYGDIRLRRGMSHCPGCSAELVWDDAEGPKR